MMEAQEGDERQSDRVARALPRHGVGANRGADAPRVSRAMSVGI